MQFSKPKKCNAVAVTVSGADKVPNNKDKRRPWMVKSCIAADIFVDFVITYKKQQLHLIKHAQS